MRNIEEAKKKITPRQYNEMLRHLALQNIYLKELKASVEMYEWKGQARLDFTDDAKLLRLTEEDATVEVRYVLRATVGQSLIFSMEATYLVTFKLNEAVSDEFFEIYNHYSLPLQTYPYFRELVSSTLSKMDLPRLILPLRNPLVGEIVKA